jgi:valacyclovir hydrolase
MPFADLSTGATLYYLDTGGNKPPLVLLHGLLDVPEVHYPKLIDWLKQDYRVIAPSMRGYGQSTPKPRTFPPKFYHQDAVDVLALLQTLNLSEKAHLLGYSDGGEIALIAAGTQPERFKSVSVWGAVGYFGPAMRPVAQRMYPGDWIKDEEVTLHGIPDRNAFVLGWINSVKGMIDAGGDVSLSLAPKITCPLLLMLGDQDTLNPEEYGQNFVNRSPNGQLKMFPCGHAIHDQAWEAFQEVVGAFLEANNG